MNKEILHKRYIPDHIRVNALKNYSPILFEGPFLKREIESGFQVARTLIPERFHKYIRYDYSTYPYEDVPDDHFVVYFYLEFV